jgi:YD repeat-containing protein
MRKTLLIIFLALTTGRADAEDMTRKEIKHEDGEKTIETYDSKGRLIELHDLDNSAKLTRRVNYKYNSAGQNSERRILNPDGSQQWRLEFTFDNQSRRIEQREFDGSDRLVYRHTYEYAPGKKIRHKTFDATGKQISDELEDMA